MCICVHCVCIRLLPRIFIFVRRFNLSYQLFRGGIDDDDANATTHNHHLQHPRTYIKYTRLLLFVMRCTHTHIHTRSSTRLRVRANKIVLFYRREYRTHKKVQLLALIWQFLQFLFFFLFPYTLFYRFLENIEYALPIIHMHD